MTGRAQNRTAEPALYRFRNATEENPAAEIAIYDDIGPSWLGLIGAVGVRRDVNAAKAAGAKSLDVRVNSGGGDVFEGFAIYETIRDAGIPTTVYIDGIAASIASVIAMAGSEIRIAEQAMMMIHPARGIVAGEAKDFRRYADLLDTLREQILDVYAKRPRVDRAAMAAAVVDGEELWLTGREAIDRGLADKLTGEQAVEARYSATMHDFKHDPNRRLIAAGAGPLLLPDERRSIAAGRTPPPATSTSTSTPATPPAGSAAAGGQVPGDVAAARSRLAEMAGWSPPAESFAVPID
jgi:ATP-dependent protease ClpP protease subunit